MLSWPRLKTHRGPASVVGSHKSSVDAHSCSASPGGCEQLLCRTTLGLPPAPGEDTRLPITLAPVAETAPCWGGGWSQASFVISLDACEHLPWAAGSDSCFSSAFGLDSCRFGSGQQDSSWSVTDRVRARGTRLVGVQGCMASPRGRGSTWPVGANAEGGMWLLGQLGPKSLCLL